MGTAHSAERIQAVRRLAGDGLRDREIGAELGLSKDAIAKIRERNDIPPGRPRSVPSESVARIISMAADGATDVEIGKAIGMTKSAVQAVRKRRGIEPGRKVQVHVHGTPSMYNSGCRCDECRICQRERKRVTRANMKERFRRGEVEIVHGRSGYINWGCRCDVCSRRHAEHCKEYDKRRREADPDGVKAAAKARRVANWTEIKEGNDRRIGGYQAETRKKADKHGQTWTSQELEIVGGTELTVKQVALMLGRSYHAVRTQRTRLFAKPSERKAVVVRTHGLGGYGRGCRCETCVEGKREYAEQYSKTHSRKVQAETIRKAGNRGKEWTGGELEIAARDDLPIKEIARRLGRSYYAVTVIRHKIKHDPKTINFAGIPRGAVESGGDDGHAADPPATE